MDVNSNDRRILLSDYERIAKAITFITQRVKSQPTLDEVAAHLHMSPFHFQRIFRRWAGVTPKKYLQILTVERAKVLLSESKPLLEVSDVVGLSSGSRLYDHFVNLEAVTPGEYKTAGTGITIDYAVHESPFGNIFIAVTARGVCKLSFLNHDNIEHDIENDINELQKKWPNAIIHENHEGTSDMVNAIFAGKTQLDRPLSLHVTGTNFQINVWKALLEIPPGAVISYTQMATNIDRLRAARAVGTAIGANPVAFLIPCHRVIQQSGKLGGYHWGETRKHAIHAWETAKYT